MERISTHLPAPFCLYCLLLISERLTPRCFTDQSGKASGFWLLPLLVLSNLGHLISYYHKDKFLVFFFVVCLLVQHHHPSQTGKWLSTEDDAAKWPQTFNRAPFLESLGFVLQQNTDPSPEFGTNSPAKGPSGSLIHTDLAGYIRSPVYPLYTINVSIKTLYINLYHRCGQTHKSTSVCAWLC